jgi:hypothetical protein
MVPIKFDFWPCPRPLTKHWGSGAVFSRIAKAFGMPDVAFGKTDNIPEITPLFPDSGIFFVDLNNGYNWASLPFLENQFKFGYWDPPYDKLYRKEGQEIWRVCQRLAILHPLIWPRAWLLNAKREAMVAVTFGPLKMIRCLQIFRKNLE